MGVFTYEEENNSSIPPAKLFKAFLLDGDNLFPKAAPQVVKGSEIIEGNGGVGTIKKIIFAEGSAFSYAVHKIEAIDEANLSYDYSVIESDGLGDNIERVKHEIKLVPGPNGGTIIKEKSHLYPKGNYQIDEEKVKGDKQKLNQLFQLAEIYLKEHPELYN